MRKFFGGLFLMLLFLNLSAQQGLDSLRQLLVNTKEDTARINLMNRIAGLTAESRPDLTFKYGYDALDLSGKSNYIIGKIEAIRNLSSAFLATGDFPKSLEFALDALKKSEAIGNKKLVASCLTAIGGIYSYQKDYQLVLPYARKTVEIYDELHDQAELASAFVNIGNTYYNLDKLDSSRNFLNRALEISLQEKDEFNVAAVYLNLGMVHSKMKDFDIAKAFYNKALPVFIANNNSLFLYSTYYFLSDVFDFTHNTDSALYYSRLALHHANLMGSPVNLADIAKQLASHFKKSGQLDSAYFYQAMAIKANDSLNSREKELKVQMLTFNEQLRQMQIAEQKLKDAEERKRNLELIAIAIFIPFFFLTVLFLSRRKVKSRTIEFLGVLSLLFLFEFIILFVHPYIGHWTHESPVWMLLILVAIAMILVPLHHRSEAWVKSKLSHKPRTVLHAEAINEAMEK